MTFSPPLVRVASALQVADAVTIMTGAGISVDSGLGTYRTGDTALWTPELMERFANPRGFVANLPEAWRWYDARRTAMREARPNAGHRAIATMERFLPVTVITQNIDGLHQQASSTDVIELHGSLAAARCHDCGRAADWPSLHDLPTPPRCECGGLLRPGVVMFEEMLDDSRVNRATERAVTAPLFISVGTSATVTPAAWVTESSVKAGSLVAIVNPDMAGQPRGRNVVHLTGPSSALLPDLVRAAWPEDHP